MDYVNNNLFKIYSGNFITDVIPGNYDALLSITLPDSYSEILCVMGISIIPQTTWDTFAIYNEDLKIKNEITEYDKIYIRTLGMDQQSYRVSYLVFYIN